MAKEIAGIIKLQIKGGAANPSPPVGPALGAKGVNIMQFCKQFNARTQELAGKVLPVIITVYADKSFDFIIKQPPVAVQVLEAAKVKSGSAEPHVKKVGSITWDQVKEIEKENFAIIGHHSHTHEYLIEKSDQDFIKDIEKANSEKEESKTDDSEVKEEDFSKTHIKVKNMIE